MAANRKATRARKAAEDAWGNPYVQRVMQDAELRENVRSAFDSVRNAYGRLHNGKPASKQLMDDKKLHKELKQAADSLRDAGQALAKGPKKKKRRGLGRVLFVGVLGAGIAVAVSESLRDKVLDALFGSEEEFDYSSTASANEEPSPEPASTSTS